MKINCISDLHGFLPSIEEVSNCDLLLIAGDFSPSPRAEYEWTYQSFVPWLQEVDKKTKIISVAGNHDRMYESNPELIPKGDYWTYLQDSGTEFKGLKIFGSPWQKIFYDWAFNLTEIGLARKWKLIPDDTDILITHSPPYGYMDFSIHGNEHCGSPSLLERVREINPRLHVFGHIHEGYGQYNFDKTIMVNASHVNNKYEPINPIIAIELV